MDHRTRWLIGSFAAFLLQAGLLHAEPNPAPKAPQPMALPAPRSTVIPAEAWRNAPRTPLEQGEIDRLVARELQTSQVPPAPRTTDEQFIRRATLDLTGQLPLPADVQEFVADRDPAKRARLIDRLLASDEYARHWARYWREVIAARTSDRRGLVVLQALEDWLAEQLAANRSWGQIVTDIVTAQGVIPFQDGAKNGAAGFLASRVGPEADNEQAAETARIFLGIQIQCAQCHDHPSDVWKREQFHEFAAYFSRLQSRPTRNGAMLTGIQLFQVPREHQMPSKEDPKRTVTLSPRFLDGQALPRGLSDRERRQALARSLVAPENYWFAGAYVNRIWGELMGQSFYQPVDDMGPQKEAVFPEVLTRLAGAFTGSGHDMKALFRAILTSETYQRQIRLGEYADQHLHFAASYPTRLRAEALWDSLVSVLGSLAAPPGMGRPRPPMGAPPFGRFDFEGLFKAEFSFDPSLKPDEVEGSISQALLLMNNPVIQQRIRAQGTNLLGRILTAYPQDDDALRMVYLRALARKPTDRERQTCRDYIQKVGSRAEAFEDILWALLNSTEFQTRR